MLLAPASRACSRTAARIPLRETRSPPIPGPPLPTSLSRPTRPRGVRRRSRARTETGGSDVSSTAHPHSPLTPRPTRPWGRGREESGVGTRRQRTPAQAHHTGSSKGDALQLYCARRAPGTEAVIQGKGRELQAIPVLQTPEGQGGAPEPRSTSTCFSSHSQPDLGE